MHLAVRIDKIDRALIFGPVFVSQGKFRYSHHEGISYVYISTV